MLHEPNICFHQQGRRGVLVLLVLLVPRVQSGSTSTPLPSLSSSMWLMRRAMAAFSSLARSLALTASATISCHSSTWLCVSSALPDSLACEERGNPNLQEARPRAA